MIDIELIKSEVKHVDWYLRLKEYFAKLNQSVGEDKDRKNELNEQLRDLFEELVAENAIALGAEQPRLDQYRQKIDTVVIHHTSQPAGIRLERLNVIHLLNIYMPYFQKPSKHEEFLKGAAITSNHLVGGKPVFYGYHWLLHMDGTATRLLDDDSIGWHAGNWNINCRSVGICVDNDYEVENPPDDVLRALAILIKVKYPLISASNLLGHCEANPKTICPGKSFISEWKPRLQQALDKA